MLGSNFRRRSDSGYRILCLGAHADDIEIGCAGTILQLLEAYDDTNIYAHTYLYSNGPSSTTNSRTA